MGRSKEYNLLDAYRHIHPIPKKACSFEFLRKEEVKHEIKLFMKPFIDMIIQELYPYIYLEYKIELIPSEDMYYDIKEYKVEKGIKNGFNL